jgi:hypothetical protein
MSRLHSHWLAPVILAALLSLAVSAFAGYFHNDKELAQRITAVEVQQKNDTKAIDRVESKLDKLYEYLTGRKP